MFKGTLEELIDAVKVCVPSLDKKGSTALLKLSLYRMYDSLRMEKTMRPVNEIKEDFKNI